MLAQRIKLVLTGPLRGATRLLRHHQYVDGITWVTGSPDEISGVCTYHGKCWQAYPAGSLELEAAQAEDENRYGKRVVQTDRPEPVPSEVLSDGGGPTEAPSVLSGSDDESEAGDTGVLPEGGGSESADEPASADDDIREAIKTLDPNEDSHWTRAGRPAVTAIEAICGRFVPRVTIDKLAPNWSRETAHGQT